MREELTLASAPVGAPLVLVRVDGPPELVRRLAALGLRRGVGLQINQFTAGRGRIVAAAGSRVALGSDVLRRVIAEAVS